MITGKDCQACWRNWIQQRAASGNAVHFGSLISLGEAEQVERRNEHVFPGRGDGLSRFEWWG